MIEFAYEVSCLYSYPGTTFSWSIVVLIIISFVLMIAFAKFSKIYSFSLPLGPVKTFKYKILGKSEVGIPWIHPQFHPAIHLLDNLPGDWFIVYLFHSDDENYHHIHHIDCRIHSNSFLHK